MSQSMAWEQWKQLKLQQLHDWQDPGMVAFLEGNYDITDASIAANATSRFTLVHKQSA